jgi:hypothetical protein
MDSDDVIDAANDRSGFYHAWISFVYTFQHQSQRTAIPP